VRICRTCHMLRLWPSAAHLCPFSTRPNTSGAGRYYRYASRAWRLSSAITTAGICRWPAWWMSNYLWPYPHPAGGTRCAAWIVACPLPEGPTPALLVTNGPCGPLSCLPAGLCPLPLPPLDGQPSLDRAAPLRLGLSSVAIGALCHFHHYPYCPCLSTIKLLSCGFAWVCGFSDIDSVCLVCARLRHLVRSPLASPRNRRPSLLSPS
jgi:hypothetical protein